MLKDFGFVFGEVGENFAVDADVGFEELVDKLRIAHAVFAGGGVDLNRPEVAHGAFLFLAVGELETPGMEDGFFCLTVFRFARPQITLRVLKESFASQCCS